MRYLNPVGRGELAAAAGVVGGLKVELADVAAEVVDAAEADAGPASGSVIGISSSN